MYFPIVSINFYGQIEIEIEVLVGLMVHTRIFTRLNKCLEIIAVIRPKPYYDIVPKLFNAELDCEILLKYLTSLIGRVITHTDSSIG
jgi:hypothetical protein